MKIEHIAALGVVALIAYKLGHARATAPTASQQANAADSQAEWWTYAGTWRG